MLAWTYLLAAIATEVAATVALKESDGFSRLSPSLIVVIGYGLSFWFLALALKHLELSLVYAVWAGIGTAAIAVIGIASFGEPATAMKLGSIALVIAGVIGLNFAGAH
jgi:small multidrug resistance pump